MPDDFKCDVFPSHHHADKPRVRRLKAAGVRVWGRPKAEVGRMKAKVPIHPSSPVLHPLPAGRRFIPLLLGDCALPDTLRRYKVLDIREESEAWIAEDPDHIIQFNGERSSGRIQTCCRQDHESKSPPTPHPRHPARHAAAEAAERGNPSV